MVGLCCCSDVRGECVKEVADVVTRPLELEPELFPEELLVEGRVSRAASALPGILGPPVMRASSYGSEQEELHGDPLCQDKILFLRLHEKVYEANLAIYINGFRVTSRDARSEPLATGTWSPLSGVEACQVQRSALFPTLAVFKLTAFSADSSLPNLSHYFGTTGDDAMKSRDMWMQVIGKRIQRVTSSLFPPHGISVRPLRGVKSTNTRIMAGYLLQCRGADSVSLVYCELQAHAAGSAKLTIYKDDWCELEVGCLSITAKTTLSCREAEPASIFSLDGKRFCARTMDERDLWLRAVMSVKVKLQADAPDPSSQDLAVFRAALQETAQEMGAPALEGQREPHKDSVLRLRPQLPSAGTTGTGDDSLFEPTELTATVGQQSDVVVDFVLGPDDSWLPTDLSNDWSSL